MLLRKLQQMLQCLHFLLEICLTRMVSLQELFHGENSQTCQPPSSKDGWKLSKFNHRNTRAKRNGVDEAILLDHNGNVSEAPGENIFIVREGQMATPSLASAALEGITRDAVIKIARDLDIEIVERDVTRVNTMSDEIFLTGTQLK